MRIHNPSITGSLNISGSLTLNQGDVVTANNVSGSSTSTGSFGQLQIDGSTLITTAGGNVGIGTTTPNRLLSLAGSTAAMNIDSSGNAFITIDRGATNDVGQIEFKTAGVAKWYVGMTDAGNYSDGTEFYIGEGSGAVSNRHLIVDASGNIEFQATNAIISGSATSTGSFGQLFVDKNIRAQADGSGVYFRALQNTSGFALTQFQSDGGTPLFNFGLNSSNNLYYYSHGTGAVILEIGRTTENFDFKGNTIIAGDVSGSSISTGSFGAGRFAEKVGIGITNPQAALHVESEAANVVLRVGDNSAGIGLDFSYDTAGYTEAAIYNRYASNDASKMVFGFGLALSDAPVMTLLKSGNVGIGTESPVSITNHKVVEIKNTATNGRATLALTANASEYSNLYMGDADDIDVGGIQYYHGTNVMDFYVGGSSRLHINNSGNVGIGTATPDFKLDVEGDIRATGNVYAENYIVSSSVTSMSFAQNSGSTIFGDSSDDIHQITGSLMVSASGLIGIGTNNPSNPIHIRGTDAFMSFTHETNSAQAGILYRNTSGTNVGFAAYNFSTNLWQVRVSSGTRLTLASSYIEFPTSNFKISGSATSTGSFGMVTAGVSTAQAGGKFHVQGVGAGQALGIIEDTSGNANFLIKATAANKNSILLFGDAASDEIGRIDYDHQDNSMDLITNNSTALTIDSSGNVGIGVTDPDTKLEVDGNIFASGANRKIYVGESSGAGGTFGHIGWNDASNYLYIGHSYGSAFNTDIVIEHGGNVGIGITNPTFKLHVSGSTDILHLEGSGAGGPQLRLTDNSATSDGDNFGYVDFLAKDSGGSNVTMNRISNVVVDNTAGTTDSRLTINNRVNGTLTEVLSVASGQVGIGTTSPSDLLHVYKSGALSVEFESNTGNADLTINSGTDGAVEKSSLIFQANSTSKWEILKTNDGDFMVYDYGRSASVIDIGLNGNMSLMANGGNVGIGTTSPDNTLTINGGVSISGSAPMIKFKDTDDSSFSRLYHSAGRLIFDADHSDGTQQAGSYISFRVDDSEKMRISGSGNVGIGITSPEGLLHIFTADASIAPNADADELIVENSGNAGISILSGNTSNGAIFFGDAQDNNVGIIDYDHNVNQLSFTTGATKAMTINASANVGIGTTNPGSLLHLVSSNSEEPIITIENTNDNDGGPALVLRKNASNDAEADNDTCGNINFQGQDTGNNIHNFGQIKVNSADVTNGLEDGHMRLGVMYNGSSDPEHAINIRGMTHGAYVGIGKAATNPVASLHVTGSSSVETAVFHGIGTAANVVFAYNSSLGQHLINWDSSKLNISADSGNAVGSSNISFLVDNTAHFRIAANGDLTATDTSIGSISDERTKKNIHTYSGSLSMINTLRPVTFEWKSSEKNNGVHRGFIAQEVTSSDAYWVREDSVYSGSADYQYLEGTTSIDEVDDTARTGLVSKLTEKDTMYVSAIQELTQAVRDLRAMITGSTDLNQLKASVSSSLFV